jgi:hypothetical protein
LEDRKDILRNYNFRCFYFLDITNIVLQKTPEDDVFQALSRVVGPCAIHLGVELGLSMAAIEGIIFMHPKNSYDQTTGVLKDVVPQYVFPILQKDQMLNMSCNGSHL